MDSLNLLKAAFLGILEGGTEFIPVSSTGHLILMGHILGFESTGKTFEVLVQLGAILAIMLVYAKRLIGIVLCLPTDEWARRFVFGIFIAFLPAAIVGALTHKYIKALFNFPAGICVALILGGIVLIFVDKMTLEVKEDNAFRLSLKTAFLIGCCQLLALFPGVSRSGSTIVGAMLMGVSKRAAAEFSFFLAMPTMAGAFAFDLYKNYQFLDGNDMTSIIIGFVLAFISGLFVVQYVLDYISKNGYAFFGYWRIIVGTAGLIAIATMK